MNVKKSYRYLLIPLFLVFFVGCGGGGGSDDNTSPPLVEMSINNNVVVPKDEIKIESILSDTTMLVDGDIKNNLTDEIIFIPSSDTVPDGFFMKVSKIEKQIDSAGKVKSKISYRTPELNEVVSELKLEEKNIVNDLVVSKITIPIPVEMSSSSLNKQDSNIMAGGKESAGVIFGNSKDDGVIGIDYDEDEKRIKFSFKNLEILKDKNDRKILSKLIALNGGVELKLNNMTPVSEINEKNNDYKLSFNTEYDLNVSADITVKGDFDVSYAKLLEEGSRYRCGDIKYVQELGSKENNHVFLEFGGTKWQDNICLGGIQFTAGAVNVLFGNGKTSKIPISIDMFLTMNSKLEISAEAKLALSYHQLTKTGINVDIKNKDTKKRLTAYKESYDPDFYEKEGKKITAALKMEVGGKIKGSLTKQVGVAVGLRFANIYPAVIEASGSISFDGEVNGLSSVDANGEIVKEVCAKTELKPEVNIYFSTGFFTKEDILIDSLIFSPYIKEDTNVINYYYNYTYEFDNIAKSDTCGTYKGIVNYDLKESSSGFSIKNLTLDEEVEKISFIVHDSTGKIVKEVYNKKEATFNLKYGVYTFYLFIKTKSGKKYLDSRLVVIKDSKNAYIEDALLERNFIFNTYHRKNMVLKDKYCQNTSAGGEFCIDDSLTYPIIETDNKKLKFIIEKFIQKHIELFYKTSSKEDVSSMINDIGYSDTYVNYEKINLYSVMEKIVTFSHSIYLTSGGAHGHFAYKYYHYNIETGKEIFLKDIFIDGYENKLKEIAEKVYRESVNISEDTDLRDVEWFDNEFILAESYAIGSDGLLFLYVPYEIKAFAFGFTEFTIPYSRLKSILKPNIID